MYANTKDAKIAYDINVATTGVVASSVVDLRKSNRIVDEFAVMAKGYTYTIISPTYKNGGFETAGGGAPDVFGSWDESVEAGTVLSQTAVAGEFHGGAKACKIACDAAGSYGRVKQGVLTVGREYTVSFWAKGSAAAAKFEVINGLTAFEFVLTAAYAQYTTTFIASHADLYLGSKSDAANIGLNIFLDDVTVTATVAEELAPTAFTAALEVSMDNVHWTSIQAILVANDGVVLIVANKPCDRFRFNVTLFTKAAATTDFVTMSLLGA